MNLTDLKENRFSKLRKALSEVFNLDLNFDVDSDKLAKIKTATDARIDEMHNTGVDVSDKQFQKLLLIKEGLDVAMEKAQPIMENDLDQAEVLLAAKQMADDLQKMAEDLASMQVEELMSITNAMKEEVGVAEAEAFSASAEAAIQGALDAVKSANDDVTNAVAVASGEAPATDMEMDMDGDMDADMDMEPEADVEMDDEFAGADVADMDSDGEGREMKEDAYLTALKMVKEAQSEGKVSKDVLKQAFAVLKK